MADHKQFCVVIFNLCDATCGDQQAKQIMSYINYYVIGFEGTSCSKGHF